MSKPNNTYLPSSKSIAICCYRPKLFVVVHFSCAKYQHHYTYDVFIVVLMLTTSSWLNKCQFWQIYHICAFSHSFVCIFMRNSSAHYFKHLTLYMTLYNSKLMTSLETYIYAHEEKRIISVRTSASCSRNQHLTA